MSLFSQCVLDGEFEPLDITPYSPPPELPEVMKPQEAEMAGGPN